MTSDSFDAAGDLDDELSAEATQQDEEQSGAAGSWFWTIPGIPNGRICTISYECTYPHVSCGS